MSHSTHSANYIRVAKALVLKPIKIHLHFETHLTVVLNGEQEYAAFKEILLIQKSVILLFYMNLSWRYDHSILLHLQFQSLAKQQLRIELQVWHIQQFPGASLYFITTLWRTMIPSPSINLTGSYSRCFISTSHTWIAPCLGLRHIRRSAEVQQFRH